jgi:hypothetical protein
VALNAPAKAGALTVASYMARKKKTRIKKDLRGFEKLLFYFLIRGNLFNPRVLLVSCTKLAAVDSEGPGFSPGM